MNMNSIQNRLFVDLDYVYGQDGWELDDSDPENLVARLSGKQGEAELSINKDLLTLKTKWGKDKTYNLEGVVVYTPVTGKVYVPRQAVNLMKLAGIH